MTLTVRPATEDDIRYFAEWRYEPPYDVYDITETSDEAVRYFLGTDVHCHVLVESDDVIAFATFGSDAHVPGGDYTKEALDIGLGVDPALTGQGNGDRYISSIVTFARSVYDLQTLRVTIAANNTRAIQAWTAVGFRKRDDFLSPKTVMGTKRFIIFELD